MVAGTSRHVNCLLLTRCAAHGSDGRMKTRLIQFRIDWVVDARMRAHLETVGATVQGFVRHALTRYLDEQGAPIAGEAHRAQRSRGVRTRTSRGLPLGSAASIPLDPAIHARMRAYIDSINATAYPDLLDSITRKKMRARPGTLIKCALTRYLDEQGAPMVAGTSPDVNSFRLTRCAAHGSEGAMNAPKNPQISIRLDAGLDARMRAFIDSINATNGAAKASPKTLIECALTRYLDEQGAPSVDPADRHITAFLDGKGNPRRRGRPRAEKPRAKGKGNGNGSAPTSPPRQRQKRMKQAALPLTDPA